MASTPARVLQYFNESTRVLQREYSSILGRVLKNIRRHIIKVKFMPSEMVRRWDVGVRSLVPVVDVRLSFFFEPWGNLEETLRKPWGNPEVLLSYLPYLYQRKAVLLREKRHIAKRLTTESSRNLLTSQLYPVARHKTDSLNQWTTVNLM